MKSLQLSALKSVERFVLRFISQPTTHAIGDLIPPSESDLMREALETKQIIQRAICDGELQPDHRMELLSTLKRALQALNTAKSFNTGLPTLDTPEGCEKDQRGISSYALCSEIEAVIRRAGL